jgi:hypothetical protein
MPNHIKNKLEIIGTSEQVKEVRDFLKGDNYEDGSPCYVDFNKILPIPEVVNNVGQIHLGISTAVKKKYNAPFHDNDLIAMLEKQNRDKQQLVFEKKEDQDAFERACNRFSN